MKNLTKVLLCCTCVLCAIIAVLNLTDRLNYNGIQKACEMVTAKTDLVKSELSYLQIVGDCTDAYDPSTYQSFHLEPAWETLYDGKPVEDIESYRNHYHIIMFDGLAGLPGTEVTLVAEMVYIDPEDVNKVENMLFFLSHSSATNISFFYAINIISFYTSALFNIFFDTLPVVFSLLRAVLYLIGLG